MSNTCFSFNEEKLIDVIPLDRKTQLEIEAIIQKSWIEIQNGISVKRLKFTHPTWTIQKIKTFLLECTEHLLKKEGFNWLINPFVVHEENEISLISFCKNHGNSKKNELGEQKELDLFMRYPQLSIFEKSIVLNDISCRTNHKGYSKSSISYLNEIANENCLITSTLAAEILTQNGHYSVPKKVINSKKNRQERITNAAIKTMFEDKIDVHSYNFFELVHPAYARQYVVLACYINEYLNRQQGEKRCMDVGTGPGNSLKMLLEMIPDLKVHAVEPSESAFTCLQQNIKDMPQVYAEQVNFFEMNIDNKVSMITSVGASHHFNTNFFFQKAWDFLQDEGVLLIADEFISPFSNCQDRDRNLILHHTGYMLSIMINISKEVSRELTPDEMKLVQWFSNEIPLAAYYAYNHHVERASHICRMLSKKTNSLSLISNFSNPFIVFYRLQLLELEALIAGLDYEMEQKTYPERLCQMATSVGFSMMNHSRIYATYGSSDMDAGTHAFVFEKNSSDSNS